MQCWAKWALFSSKLLSVTVFITPERRKWGVGWAACRKRSHGYKWIKKFIDLKSHWSTQQTEVQEGGHSFCLRGCLGCDHTNTQLLIREDPENATILRPARNHSVNHGWDTGKYLKTKQNNLVNRRKQVHCMCTEPATASAESTGAGHGLMAVSAHVT